MAKSPYRAMPSPGDDLAALRATVAAIHETVETLIGVRGPRGIANQVFTGNTAPPGPEGCRRQLDPEGLCR